MRSQLHGVGYFLLGLLVFSLFAPNSWASPTFLNRQTFPLHLGLSDIGHFHQNDLQTFEIWTQWNNPAPERIVVRIRFTFVDKDSANRQLGEDGEDDALMVITETVTIPEQVSNWGKYLQLTAIGEKLNLGYDHPEEGAGLELYLDAQVISVEHLPAE